MNNILHQLAFYLWIVIITAFVVWQIWNLTRAFTKGKIYDLSRTGLRRGYLDEYGKYHMLRLVDKLKSRPNFILALIVAVLTLIISIIVLAISLASLIYK